MVLGQAAGTAAALALKGAPALPLPLAGGVGVERWAAMPPLQSLDVNALTAALQASGAVLHLTPPPQGALPCKGPY